MSRGKSYGTDGLKKRLEQIEQGGSVNPINFRPSKTTLTMLLLYMDSNGINSITDTIENMIADVFLMKTEKGEI